MPVDPAIRRLALSCLLLGFVGPTPPRWLLDALARGLGGVVLFGSNLGDGGDLRPLTDRLREAAGREVVVALDEEGGDVTRLDTARGSASPGAAALGHLDDPAATEEVYAAIGRRLASAGVTTDLAPVADVNVEAANPVIGVRSFGADPQVVARHVAAAARGLQRCGVAACVKHFPGHGASLDDSHHEVATVRRTEEELRAVELVPFAAAIAAGARAVMTGHLMVPALDRGDLATTSHRITTGLLKGELGFDGTVVTDAVEMRAISATIGLGPGFARALAAGADAVESGAQDYPELVEAIPLALADALAQGEIGIDRVEDAARRASRLARPAFVGAEPDEPGPDGAMPGDALLDDLPARCLEVIGSLPRLTAPLVVECRPAANMASGPLPWSVGAPLARLLPGVDVVAVESEGEVRAVAGATAGRSLVVVVRDPTRHGWQRPLLDLAAREAARHGRAVVVDVGWPVAPLAVPTLRTRGVAPGLLEAAARRLAQA